MSDEGEKLARKGDENVKQVIVIRRDLGMRRGKEIAQGAHASMAWMTKRMSSQDGYVWEITMDPKESLLWCKGLFTKVVCQVSSEAELLDVYERAKAAGLEVNLIEDSGLTEFAGVKTKTALAIGPDFAWEIDKITGGLKLY